MYSVDEINRFWGSVSIKSSHECWDWTKSLNHKGYGQVNIGGTIKRAHRVALEIVCGDGGKLHGLHICDNRKCCNPAHLYWGTTSQNAQDRRSRNKLWVEKSRQNLIRINKRKRKLSCEHVREIYRRVHLGENTYHLAKEFMVDQKTIMNIKQVKVYREWLM